MIYVEMLGRTGNQMFSYAHARYIQEQFPGEKIAADFTHFRRLDETWIDYLQYFACVDNISVETRRMSFIQKAVLKAYYLAHNKWSRGGV